MRPIVRGVELIAVGAALTALSACHQPAKPTTTRNTDHSEPPRVRPSPVRARQAPIIIRPKATNSSRWLFTESVRNKTPDGWATGTFDPRRNKIDIKTKDATGFAIDTSRIAINWERLVIISIDGRNSELRRRDFNVLHFHLDKHNRWVVIEP